MIYLRHPNGAIAVCEDAGRVASYEARGFTRCTLAAFRQAWYERDTKRLVELRGELPDPPPQAVEVGGMKAPVVTSMHGWRV